MKFPLNVIDFHHVLNISLMSNEKVLERIEFRHLSKLKNLIPNCSWDMVGTTSHNPEVIFSLSSHELMSRGKHLLSKGLRFTIPPRQIDYSGYLAEFQLPYRSTDLSITLDDMERFKVKLKDIAWSSYKHLNDNWK